MMIAEPAPVRRLPIVATLLVLAAVGLMIGLGIWQLHRLAWKEALIARYSAASGQLTPVPWPQGSARETNYYRRSGLTCIGAADAGAISGRNAAGQAGWAHLAQCTEKDGPGGMIVLGWSHDPAPRVWRGGHVTGVIAPYRKGAARLIADPPLAGFAANARPDPRDLPNNHLSYAVQWFLFAATALVIYGIALAKRLRDPPPAGEGDHP